MKERVNEIIQNNVCFYQVAFAAWCWKPMRPNTVRNLVMCTISVQRAWNMLIAVGVPEKAIMATVFARKEHSNTNKNIPPVPLVI